MLWHDRTQCGGSEVLLSAVLVHADSRKKQKKRTHFSSRVCVVSQAFMDSSTSSKFWRRLVVSLGALATKNRFIVASSTASETSRPSDRSRL